MINLQSITFAYPRNPAPIFERLTWTVNEGAFWAVLGPSGCGKTTLLYLLAGLRLPSSGTISIQGEPLARPRPYTGLILQEYGLLPWATLRENARLGLRLRQFYGPDGKHAPRQLVPLESAEPWLERLGITEVAHRYPGQVSGGQRQRAAIARTLALSPDLLLMDEPFSSLDAPTRTGLQSLILELWHEQRFTTILVTHSIEEAAFLGQHILLLGKPPNTSPVIFANPRAGDLTYRDSPAYTDLCRTLREQLEGSLPA